MRAKLVNRTPWLAVAVASDAGGAFAAGPVIGGGLMEAIDWESIFSINVPIGLLTAYPARVPSGSRGPALEHGAGSVGGHSAIRRIAIRFAPGLQRVDRWL
jgi:MFS family permease